MSKRRVLELLLDSVSIKETGTLSRSGRHMAAVRLIWPRPSIAEKVTARIVDIKSGKCDMTSRPWSERILFKEMVYGPFGLEAGITGHVSDGQLGKLLAFIGNAVLKTAGMETENAIDANLPSRLVGVPFKYFGKVAGTLKKMPDMISEGIIDMDTETSQGKARTWTVEVPVIASKPVVVVKRTRRHGQLTARRKTVLKAGELNGSVIMTARLYE